MEDSFILILLTSVQIFTCNNMAVKYVHKYMCTNKYIGEWISLSEVSRL